MQEEVRLCLRRGRPRISANNVLHRARLETQRKGSFCTAKLIRTAVRGEYSSIRTHVIWLGGWGIGTGILAM